MNDFMQSKPFQEATDILNVLEENGFKAYFVGGCVRDFLLHRPMQDIDITTSAKPNQIQKLFDKVIPVGVEHGTVIVRHKKKSYEVTTFRTDNKSFDNNYSNFISDGDRIKADLAKRDFTMNALAIDTKGHLIDLYGGQKDLDKKIIRTVGSGVERFKEDPIRIIRAIRFVSQFGFSIEKKTLDAMIALKGEIESTAIERIQHEMEKFFAGKYVNNGFTYLKELGLYRHLPVFKKEPSLIHQFYVPIHPLYSFGEVIAVCQCIYPIISIQNWVKDWKCSNNVKKEATALVEAIQLYITHGFNSWLVYQIDPKYDEGFIRIIHYIYGKRDFVKKDIEQVRKELVISSKQDLHISGEDVIRMFPTLNRGPWINQLLMNIEKEVVTNNLANNKNDIKEWIRCNPPVIN